MRVLVTGAAGFIGSHLSERLACRGDDVTGFDSFDGFYPRRIKERNLGEVRAAVAARGAGGGRFAFLEGDIRRAPDLTPDILRHFMATGFETVSFDAPDGYVLSVGAQRYLGAPAAFDAERVLFSFTGDGDRPA